MRVLAEIPHPQIKVTLFGWNGKYIIKLEAGPYEQSFKIKEEDVQGLDQVKAMLTPEFVDSCIQRFISMKKDLGETWKKTLESPTPNN